ncbi:hypothetical protein BOTBODRAFT_172261 [Botryobasidium botryosum FD-172 SS1]|uniref:Uncharacterized protein n=1 Tax=Botryobasidium botryosum (strain FD-172 SS1) TaxID=930990 RepID=A0A067MN47_BOTB1|nr:hypothetical protein BOTBODRAFT_172261 [Botryobasidium botryosum FD-172 SS1]
MSLACIAPNPDIAGIGVRVSIYAQNLLAFIPSILFLADNDIDPIELESMGAISTSILVTACALLISAFIQAATFGLSVYHALIVLNLSWINNMNAVVYCLLAVESEGAPIGALDFLREVFRMDIRGLIDSGAAAVIGLATLHLSAMGALGLWVWSKVDEFGDQPQCTPYTLYVLFGRSFSATDKPLRIGSLVLYSITAFPLVNLFFFFFLGWAFSAISSFVVFLYDQVDDYLNLPPNIGTSLFNISERMQYYSMLAFSLIAQVLFIADTELMIRRSADLVQEGESQWTFGQTLAMLLLVLPLVDVVKETWEWVEFEVSFRKKQQEKKEAKDKEPEATAEVTHVTQGTEDATSANQSHLGARNGENDTFSSDVGKVLERWEERCIGEEEWVDVMRSLRRRRAKVEAGGNTEQGKDIEASGEVLDNGTPV